MNLVVVNIKKKYTQTALLKNGKAIEVLIDDKDNVSKVGNIYMAIVRDVHPNFCFVDIAGETGFLQEQSFKERDLVLVQVKKDKTETKATFVSQTITLAGKYIVLRKNANSVTISKKIEGAGHSEFAKTICPKGYGIVLRTDSEKASEEDIAKEVTNLHNKIEEMNKVDSPSLLYSPNEITYYESSLRSFLPEAEKIVTNNDIDKIKKITEGYELLFTTYSETHDLFNEYEINKQLDMREKVWLKSGGYILIEQTKALIVIDVNTGKSLRKDMFLRTNKEAAAEIAYQLRLRNLSGMIMVDFINMSSKDDEEELLKHLIEETKKDRIKVNVLGITNLGLIELTRKKTRETLKTSLYNIANKKSNGREEL
ncbi:MAG: ribonuclease E/G [Defluviitaleaceae bacterium]|nr:ribonuclease E/G [Defluviitaleaceae bacterium]